MKIIMFFLYGAAIFLTVPGEVYAAGVWTPDTGQVCWSEAYEDGVTEQFYNAFALMTFGYTRQGIWQAERVLRRHPDHAEALSAKYHLGLAHRQVGNYEESFRHLGDFAAAAAQPGEVRIARKLQLDSAIEKGERSIRGVRPLFEELISVAREVDFVAECRWELAELLFRKGRFHDAMDAYLDFVDFHPGHENVPEAWFRVADCHYRIAIGVDRGRQLFANAESALKDFLVNFPQHERADEAREKLSEIRRMKAERLREVADYYMRVRRRPHAAIDRLRDIKDDYPDTGLAEWAGERIKEIKAEYKIPPPGGHIRLPLESVD